MLVYPAATVLIVAFALDCIIGDPQYPLHPVRLIGRMITGIKNALFEIELNGRFSGWMLTVVMVLLMMNIYIILRSLLEIAHPLAPIPLDIFIVYSCIALKDLIKHAMQISSDLDDDDLKSARKSVGMIVGRDTSKLDKHSIARAGIESVAENFVDGFLAPLFWYATAAILANHFILRPVVAATAAVLIYRTVNTMDAMIGYKNEEYRLFGAFAARLDDVLNFIPARLCLLVLTPAALVCRMDTKTAVKIFLRDRKKHDSPNSAHAESFTAGALGLKLGGPTEYPHGTVEKPWLGDGSEDASAGQIHAACKLVTLAGWITVIICIIILP